MSKNSGLMDYLDQPSGPYGVGFDVGSYINIRMNVGAGPATIIEEIISKFGLTFSDAVEIVNKYSATSVEAKLGMATIYGLDEYKRNRGRYPDLYAAVEQVSSYEVATDIWNVEYDPSAVSPMGLGLLMNALGKVPAGTTGYLDFLSLIDQKNIGLSKAAGIKKKKYSKEDAEVLAKDVDLNKYKIDQIVLGLNDETEHDDVFDNEGELLKVVLEHLDDKPDYYTKLKQVEAEKYRKVPVIVNAERATEAGEIETLEGVMSYSKGDWLVTGVEGEQYPVAADIFEQTFEPMDKTSSKQQRLWWVIPSCGHDCVVRATSEDQARLLVGIGRTASVIGIKGPFWKMEAALSKANSSSEPEIVLNRA